MLTRRAAQLGLMGLVLSFAQAHGQPQTQNSGDSEDITFREQFINQVVEGTRLSGRIGVYDFRRFHDLNQPYPNDPDQDNDYDNRATAYGGNLYLQTGMISGFSAGFGLAVAQSAHDYDNPNTNLIGADGDLRSIVAGYLQYNYRGIRVRGGRQLLNTPFAGTDQFTFVPRSFSGVSAAIRPLELFGASDTMPVTENQVEQGRNYNAAARSAPENYENDQYMPFAFGAGADDAPMWQVFGARMTRYESRFSDEFTTDNRYVPDTAGLFTLGTQYRQNTADGDYIAQLWHYNFFDTAEMQYLELGYQSPTLMANGAFGGIEPYIRMQYARESETGAAKAGEIEAEVLGLKLGVQSKYVSAALVGHYAPDNTGSFRNGQIVHPYTDLSGVFYTDTINDGVGNLGPGYALGGRLDITPTDHFSLFSRYVAYRADYGQSHDFYAYDFNNQGFGPNAPIVENQGSWGWDTGLTYDLGGLSPHLEGLTIQNVLGVTDFDGADRFYNNRLRLYYAF